MNRYAVIGLGRFGYRLAVMLSEAGAEVVAIDSRQELVDDISEHVTQAVCLDGTEEAALRAQGVDKVDVAIVGIGDDFEVSVLTTVILKQLGVPCVYSRATSNMRGDILLRVGADALVNPQAEAARQWCHRLLGPSVMEQIPLSEGHSLVQMPVPADWVGKSLAELGARRKYDVNVVAVQSVVVADDADGESSEASEKAIGPEYAIDVPRPHTKLVVGDVIFVIGADENIASLPG